MEERPQHPFKVDINTFNQLFREHYPALRAYAGFLLREDAAEDLVQDAFLATWENRDTITIHTSIKAYLFKSVYHRCLNHIRHQKTILDHQQQVEYKLKLQEVLLSDPDNNHIIQKLYMNDVHSAIDQAIDSLPDKCREVFKLSYLADLRNKQVSQQLNISVSTVEKHINHALKTLRKKLQDLSMLFMTFLLF